MPGLASVAEEYKSKGVRFFALTVWNDDQPKVTEWMNKYKAPGVAAGTASDAGAAELHSRAGRELRSIPSTVVISPDGTIKQILGAASRSEFDKAFALAATDG